MKKFLLIALVVVGFSIAGASRADAGVSVGIGIGLPFGYCGYPYGYPGYYPYGYPYYGGYYPGAYVTVVHRPYYWYHGRRIYYGHRHRWR